MVTDGTALRDRIEGGERLASRLLSYARDPDAIVVGLPPGGVVVGHVIAHALRLPLDTLAVHRLLGAARTIGAVAAGGVEVVNASVPRSLHPLEIGQLAEHERIRADRRQRVLRGARPPLDCRDKNVIVTNDGTATGAMLRAAVQTIRAQNPRRIILATPVCASAMIDRAAEDLDEIVYLSLTDPFRGAAFAYAHFQPVSDGEVAALLRNAPSPVQAASN